MAGQFIIRKRVTGNMVLQLPLCVIQGCLFNVIIYVVFGGLNLNYPFRVAFLLGGIILAAIGVAVSFFLHHPYAIREGTIVATVLFSLLMKKTINLIEKFKEKQIIHI